MDTCSCLFPFTLQHIQGSTGPCTMRIKCFTGLMTATSPQVWRHPCICYDKRCLMHLIDVGIVTIMSMLLAMSS